MLGRVLRRFAPLLLCCSLFLVSHFSVAEAGGRGGAVHVRGYFRSNGTYVQPHMRSAPDGNFYNNWSTRGNVNPYTGEAGTKVSPPANYGQDVQVQGYYRTDGTYVSPHMRSAPDGDPSNNWNTSRNTNPYTGEVGHTSGVTWLQQSLARVGNDPGPVDGILGPQTVLAFRAFRDQQGRQDESIATTLLRLKSALDNLDGDSQQLSIEPVDDAEPSEEQELPSTSQSHAYKLGDSPGAVLVAEGNPDRVRDNVWYYGHSTIAFRGGRVAGWRVVDHPLNVGH